MCKGLLLIIGMTGLLVVCYADSGRSFLYNRFHLATENMERVAIVYDRVFSYPDTYQSRYTQGCTQSTSVVQKIIYMSIMRCRSYVYLLRPSHLVRYWQRMEALKGYFPLTVQEFGVIGVHGHIKAVEPAPEDFNMHHTDNKRFSMVSGVFLTWAPVIKRYLFKDLQTGLTAGVKATPNHRFYVKNKHAFIAIDTVSSADELITSSGHKVKLLCSPGRRNHCGDPVNSGMPAMVYNLEVNRSHRYFVSGSEVLVHNGCESDACECSNCDSHGFPVKVYDNNRLIYFGQIKNKIFHGFGTTYYENGLPEYSGYWQASYFHGSGTRFYDNGKTIYDGNWTMGQPDGFGTIFRESGVIEYRGDWVLGEKSGKGECYYENGNLGYIGGIVRGIFHGSGISYHENGEIDFMGSWDFGLMREGVRYQRNGMISGLGIWENNRFFEGVGHDEITGRLHYIENGVAIDMPRAYRLDFDPIRREPREPQP